MWSVRVPYSACVVCPGTVELVGQHLPTAKKQMDGKTENEKRERERINAVSRGQHT